MYVQIGERGTHLEEHCLERRKHQQKGELHTSDCGDDKSTQKFQPHSINSEVF